MSTTHKYKGPHGAKQGESLFSRLWKDFDPKKIHKGNAIAYIDQYLDDKIQEYKYLPKIPFKDRSFSATSMDDPRTSKEKFVKSNLTGDLIRNILPHQQKIWEDAILNKLERMSSEERYKVLHDKPKLEESYIKYLNSKKSQEDLGNPTQEQQDEQLNSRSVSQNARIESESNASKAESKEDKKEQSKDTAKREEAAQESVGRSNAAQQQTEEAAKALTLGNFFDYTNPYFQYYTAPTALGLGLGSLLGGWKGGLLGAAGGAGLGALAKYLVDNDKIHMA